MAWESCSSQKTKAQLLDMIIHSFIHSLSIDGAPSICQAVHLRCPSPEQCYVKLRLELLFSARRPGCCLNGGLEQAEGFIIMTQTSFGSFVFLGLPFEERVLSALGTHSTKLGL